MQTKNQKSEASNKIVYLPVRYNRRKEAKELGAKWNGNEWYVPEYEEELFLLKFTRLTKLQGGGSSNTNFSTLYNGSIAVNGEWIQIKFPFKIILSSLSPMIRYPSTMVSRAPSQYYILGSNDGTTWFLLNIGVNTSPPGRGTYYPNTTFTALNQTPFNYIRVVITKVYLSAIPNAFQGNVAIATIQMTGTASA